MSRPNIVFCGLVRDAERRLKAHAPTFQAWQQSFPDAHWVWVENDSKDGTRRFLDAWADDDERVHVIGSNSDELTTPKSCSGKVHPAFSRHRISRMAYYRNLYLDFIEAELDSPCLKHVVIIDADVIKLPCERVLDHLRDGNDAVITAYGVAWDPDGKRRFYDAYAHEHLSGAEMYTVLGLEMARRILTELYQDKNDLIEVSSNFNALGIYPYEAFRGERYSAELNGDPIVEYLCEHVGMHRRMRLKGYSIFVDPELNVLYNRRWPVMVKQAARQLRNWLLRIKK